MNENGESPHAGDNSNSCKSCAFDTAFTVSVYLKTEAVEYTNRNRGECSKSK